METHLDIAAAATHLHAISVSAIPQLYYQGSPLDMDHVGLMQDSTPLLSDPAALQARLNEAGYIYLPGYLGRPRVIDARRQFINKLSAAGGIDLSHDPMDGVVTRPFVTGGFDGGRLDKMFPDWRKIHDVLYDGPMMQLFQGILAGAVRHYDFTWIRQVNPGHGTLLHADAVYMGRGTHQLFTAWTAMGDNNFDLGGLLLLEGSHTHPGMAKGYLQKDVDAYCENRDDKRDGWQKGWGGWIRGSPERIRQSLGYERWVTADFRMGDVVIFSIHTVHGSTDNLSDRFRLSTDTRYQRADQPIDQRWIGENPPAHGPAGKRGMIC